MRFNNKEPVYNRLSLLCGGDQLQFDQVLGAIFAALDPVDEFLHHLGGAETGIDGESEIDDGLDVHSVIHDIPSIRSTALCLLYAAMLVIFVTFENTIFRRDLAGASCRIRKSCARLRRTLYWRF